MDEGLVAALDEPASDLLTARERAAVDYAGRLAGEHRSITESTYATLHEHFDERELAELTMLTTSLLGIGRLLETLTRGMACPLPHRAAPEAPR